MIRAPGVTMARVRWSESMEWRSMGTASAPASHAVRSSQIRASRLATSSVPSTRYAARVSPSPTLTPTSGPVSVAKASSSVRSSPRKITADAPQRWRIVSRALPLLVATTPSSTTFLPSLVATPARAPGPSSTACTALVASRSPALR